MWGKASHNFFPEASASSRSACVRMFSITVRRPDPTCAVLLSDIFGLARPSPAKLQSVLAQRRTTSTEVVLLAARAMIRMAPSSTAAGSVAHHEQRERKHHDSKKCSSL